MRSWTLVRPAYDELRASSALHHLRADGDHELTRDRFEHIVDWTHARSVAVG